MAVKIYDSSAGAFKDAPTPQIYDASTQAYKDSTGLVYDTSKGVWDERWGGVIAYVYGAVQETITIKRNGIVVKQVTTDSSGRSTEQIRLACGTYDLIGSVSGWTEKQLVDRNTERFRAMPEGALYWYGNIPHKYTLINNKSIYGEAAYNIYGAICIKEKVDFTNYSKLKTKIINTNHSGGDYRWFFYDSQKDISTINDARILTTNNVNGRDYVKSGTYEADITSLKGSYYIGYGCVSCSSSSTNARVNIEQKTNSYSVTHWANTIFTEHSAIWLE